MKKSHFIGSVVIFIAMIGAMYSLQSSLTSYVSIREAKTGNRRVQVAGALVKGSPRYDPKSHNLIFALRENTGDELLVEYGGAKPANFDSATKIVAIGKYDTNKEAFMTKELLVKCPTKYEGQINER
jgi:cytochrome c-type biogenesis protein CcmE